ncbi:hypothetical protein GF352_04570 [archaeon]|nr:hypothetical protein [archaeon]
MLKMPFSDSMLLWASPGLESEPFIMELLETHLKKGLKAVLCVTDKPSQAFIEQAENYGYKLSKHLGKSLFLINFYEKLINNEGLESLKRLVKKKIKVLGNDSLVCFNNISTLINLFGFKAVSELIFLKKFVNEQGGRFICSFTEWPYTSDLLIKLRKSFDNRVYLNTVNEQKYYSFKKNGSFTHLLFDVNKPGGVTSLKPRLVVIGPKGSGKTSFIKALSDCSASIDYLSNDFGIDHAEFKYKDRVIDLFGAPGDDYEPVIELLGSSVSGVLVMIDSSRPETFSKARRIVESVRERGFNVVVGLNRVKTGVNDVKKKVGLNSVPLIVSEKGSNHDEIFSKLLSY